jgi:[protein-PII] uridylyltransferase
MLTPPDQSTRKPLFDADAIAAELEKLVPQYEGQKELRIAVAMRLKRALADARMAAEANLLKDRLGLRCAADLCLVQDQIIRVLFQFATKHLYEAESRSEAERMAVVATGGYGRGLMAPGSDIDLLFVLPYKQTAWGESIAEAILYCLWDMGLKVGHATRSVDECIRQAKADMTIRTAILEARYLLAIAAFMTNWSRASTSRLQGTAREFVTAKLAERDDRHKRAGMRAIWSSPTSRTARVAARPAHAVLDRQVRLSGARTAGAGRAPRVRPARVPDLSALRELPLGGSLQHALRGQPRRGAVVVRYPARHRGAARL